MENKINYALFCDHVNSTAEGKLNLIGLFTDINAPSLPIALPSFFMVINMTLEGGKDYKLKIEGPSDHPPLVTEITAEGSGQKDFNQPIAFVGFIFKTSGVNTFKVYINDVLKTEVPLNINLK